MNTKLITSKEIVEKLQNQDYVDSNTLIALALRLQKLEEEVRELRERYEPDNR